MPDTRSKDSTSVQLRSIVMPGTATVPLGEWHNQGLCIGEDPGVFFPSHGDRGTKARQICVGCAVRDDCLRYAIDTDEFGIWGGLDQDERRNLKRKQRRKEATVRGKTRHSEGVA